MDCVHGEIKLNLPLKFPPNISAVEVSDCYNIGGSILDDATDLVLLVMRKSPEGEEKHPVNISRQPNPLFNLWDRFISVCDCVRNEACAEKAMEHLHEAYEEFIINVICGEL